MRHYSSFEEEGRAPFRFLPDPGAVSAFYDAIKRGSHLEPEKRLLAAVLDDALKCYQKYLGVQKGRGKKVFSETEQWFWEGERDDVFAFENVCAALGLSPGYVRRLLGRWKAQARAAKDSGGAHRRARKPLRDAA